MCTWVEVMVKTPRIVTRVIVVVVVVIVDVTTYRQVPAVLHHLPLKEGSEHRQGHAQGHVDDEQKVDVKVEALVEGR